MTDDYPTDPLPSLQFDHPCYYYQGKVFVPKIFDAGPGETVPPGFNSVRVPIDGKAQSDLDWRQIIEIAHKYRADGLKLLWDIDLGLFSRLSQPFSDPSQLQALRLGIRHFIDSIWSVFCEETLGIVTYRGSLDFSERFPWDVGMQESFEQWRLDVEPECDTQSLKRIFCRDACSQYLNALVSGLPGNLQPVLLFDATAVKNPREGLQLLHRESWNRFVLVIKKSPVPELGMSWDSGQSPYGLLGRQNFGVVTLEPASIGLLLPGSDVVDAELDRELDAVLLKYPRVRVVAEEFLTAEWDGLDQLVVISSNVGPLGLRKLQGFCAAGGQVVTVGKPLGLAKEVTFA